MYTKQEQCLTLAGIFQSAQLVHHLATTGRYSQTDFETMISSLYTVDSDNVEHAYGDKRFLKSGLQQLEQFASQQSGESLKVISRYVMTLIILEKQIQKKPELIELLTTRIKRACQQKIHFSATHPHLIANLAETYIETFGKLTFRLKVVGKPQFLSNEKQADIVRALLLSGIRSVVLWRQTGGKLHQLIFFKKRLTKSCRELLSQIEQQPLEH